MRRILALIKHAAFRVAFGIAILIQLVLWLLLWGGIATFLGSSNSFVLGSLIGIALIGPFSVGAANHFIYYRVVRQEYISREAEKWLAERRTTSLRWRKHRRLVIRFALWLPSALVLVFCLCLDRTWPALTHFLHPGYSRLGKYRISMPGWTVIFNNPPDRNERRSYVLADHLQGMPKGGFEAFVGRKPSLRVSSMVCYAVVRLDSDAPAWTLDRGQLRARTYSDGGVVLDCGEPETRVPVSGDRSLEINCLTATNDLSCQFTGDPEDAADFYRIIQSIRKKK